MANYPELRKGDQIPSVGVLQKLLNSTGMSLKVDGYFGAKTEAAVKEFQHDRRLLASGHVDEATWTRLVSTRWLPIVDCMDVFDPKIYLQRMPALERVGARPLLTGGMQHGIQAILAAIGEYGGNIFLLRIVGHGRSGMQSISYGAGGYDEPNPVTGKPEWHFIDGHFEGVGLQTEEQLKQIIPIRAQLGVYGHVELYGCEVASGTTGKRFVTAFAHKLGVPVSAAVQKQRMPNAFRITGPVYTVFPDGHDLQSWCESRPDFSQMTVA